MTTTSSRHDPASTVMFSERSRGMGAVNASRCLVLTTMVAFAGGCAATGDLGGTGGRASGGAPGATGGTGGGATGGAPIGTGGAATGGAPIGTGGAATGGTSGGATGGVPGGGTGGGAGAATGGAPTGGTAGAGTGGRAAGGNAGNRAGGSGGGGTTAIGGSAGTSNPGAGGATGSTGCGQTPTLKNNGYNTLGSRQYYLRLPATYDNQRPHRLILGLHGATGKGTDVAPGFWGLYALANGSTIFVAPDAVGGLWSAASDTTFVDDILKAVEADLCIDTSRVMLEGFSQGAAMSWTLACSRDGVFRAVVGHSGGGVTKPSTCKPVPYFGSGGVQENVTQTGQTDPFATWNGCTVATLAKAPTGGHACTNYTGCPAAYPVRWCNFDGPHTPSPTDSGTTSSWMPQEVWTFLSQF